MITVDLERAHEHYQRRYLSTAGGRCPFCDSDDIHGHPGFDTGEIDQGKVFKDVRCSACDQGWTDEYSLTGFYAPQLEDSK